MLIDVTSDVTSIVVLTDSDRESAGATSTIRPNAREDSLVPDEL